MINYYKLRIKKYRRLRRISQKELAAKLGISQSFLSEIENGRYDIKLSLLCRVADVLEIDPFDLVEFYRY
jgi:transcriptional regulator with XRE-family HTH domain